MLQRALLAAIAARLVLAPWAVAEEPVHRPGPIAAAAALEAARVEAPARRGPMPNGLKWTGLGLLMGSGMPVLVATFGDCIREGRTCRNQRRAAYATAGAMAGTGRCCWSSPMPSGTRHCRASPSATAARRSSSA